MKKYIMALCVVSVGFMVQAMPLLPENCTGKTMSFTAGNALLNSVNTAGYHTYYLHNISDQSLLLNHSTGKGMEAGWASQVDANHVSVIYLNQGKFLLSCAYFNTRLESTPVDCSKVLSVCEMQGLHVPAALSQGQYWLIENQPVNNVDAALQRRGITS